MNKKEGFMKRATAFLITLFLLTAFTITTSAGGPFAFNKAKATVKKNGIDTCGEAFRKADEPNKILVLSGDVAFMVDVSANTVHDVAINSVDEKSDPVMIDYGILSLVQESELQTSGGSFTFKSKGDSYEVEMEGRKLGIY